MSKFVKSLIMDDLRQRLGSVENALLVSVAGLNAIKNNKLRMALKDKNISLLVIKNSLARRATEGTPLAAAFEQMEGSLALAWGSEDIVSLAKEITRFTDDKQFEPFMARGGVMDGARLTAAQVKEVSKWPSREEQLSILSGQILSPGANLASQLTSAGGALASQIKQKGEGDEPNEAAEAAPPSSEPAPAVAAEARAAPEPTPPPT
jgi:large subunit ribosomal protein L10